MLAAQPPYATSWRFNQGYPRITSFEENTSKVTESLKFQKRMRKDRAMFQESSEGNSYTDGY